MSTYIYLTCTCHTPRLIAEDECGQKHPATPTPESGAHP